jgi:hypothetical protein
MAKATRVLSTPPLNSSSFPKDRSPPEGREQRRLMTSIRMRLLSVPEVLS